MIEKHNPSMLNIYFMENDTLTLYFLLFPFDTPTWHVLSRMTMKEKMQLFLAFHPWDTCVFQNYKQRTTYLNWANHLVFSPLRQVCVPKLHTANHLFELS